MDRFVIRTKRNVDTSSKKPASPTPSQLSFHVGEDLDSQDVNTQPEIEAEQSNER